MKSKPIILIIPSCVITFFLSGCQKNMHHMHEATAAEAVEAPVAEVVIKHSEHNEKKIKLGSCPRVIQ